MISLLPTHIHDLKLDLFPEIDKKVSRQIVETMLGGPEEEMCMEEEGV